MNCQCCRAKSTSESDHGPESEEENEEVDITSLIEVRAEPLGGISQEVAEWEELEFMVGSGAGHTVVGPEQVKAVQAGEPNSAASYKLADGSHIPHVGSKCFEAATEDYALHQINAQVTEVDAPLLSVGQVVSGGNTVVFSPKGATAT